MVNLLEIYQGSRDSDWDWQYFQEYIKSYEKKGAVELLTEEWLTLPFSSLQPCFPNLSLTIQTLGKPSPGGCSEKHSGWWAGHPWLLAVVLGINFPPSYRRRNILLSSIKQFLERSQVPAQRWGTQRELSHRGKSSCVNKARDRKVPLWGSSKPHSCRTLKAGRIRCTESQTLKGYTHEKEIFIQK